MPDSLPDRQPRPSTHRLLRLVCFASLLLLNVPADDATAQDKGKEVDDKVADLVKQLKNKQPEQRIKAAEALGELKDKATAATPDLIAGLFDPVPQVRVTVQDALKAVNPKLSAPVVRLMEPLDDLDTAFPKTSARRAAVAQLAKMGPAAKAAAPVLVFHHGLLVQKMGKSATLETGPLIEALVSVSPDDPQLTKLLSAWLLRSDTSSNQLTLIRSLMKMKDAKNAVPVFVQVLRTDTDETVRLAAVVALGDIGSDAKAAVPVVEAAKFDAAEKVREAAKRALEKIKK